MATFLTTPRMSAALRARVERAVSHKARARHNAARLGLQGTFAGGAKLRAMRLMPIAAALIIGVFAAVAYARERRAVDAEKLAIAGIIDARRAALPKGHEGLVAATDHWITASSKRDETGDLVDDSLRAKGALDGWLKRPALYLHGPIADLERAVTVEEAAKASDKDALLLCLLAPPAATSERDLLAKVRGVYFSGAKVDEETANVRRLIDARKGLRLVSQTFQASAKMADDLRLLAEHRRELDAMPFATTQRAASAELLIIAADLPGSERKTRITLVDLVAKRVLLRVERRAEVATSSPSGALYRAEIEACSAALAARRAVE